MARSINTAMEGVLPEVSPEQVGSATVWFTTQAGITATVLAFVCIGLVAGLVWAVKSCRSALSEANAAWIAAVLDMESRWAKRMDQFRSDVKEAFGGNDKIADKMVDAMHAVEKEIARFGGRSER